MTIEELTILSDEQVQDVLALMSELTSIVVVTPEMLT